MAGRFSNLLGTVLAAFSIGTKGSRSTLSAAGLTADRAHALPDNSGTLALLSDTGRVPTRVADGATYFVPIDTQTLFAHPIELVGTGTIDVSGSLVEVA